MMISLTYRRLVFAMLPLWSPSAFASLTLMDVNVATFSLSDLLTGRRSDDFSVVLRTTGLLAIVTDDVVVPGNNEDSALLDGLCQCTSNNKEDFLSIDGTDTTIVDDGVTTRTTLATATVGTTPLPLPDSLAARCGLDTAKSMDTLRDQVAVVSDAFIYALDRMLEESEAAHRLPQQQPLLKNWDGGSYSSVKQIRDGANHLEHFHVYSKSSEDGDEYMTNDDDEKEHEANTLHWHTDAGLFLAFAPAISCNDDDRTSDKHHHHPDMSFWAMDWQTQTPMQAVFPPGSIAIMLGAGAEHWINTPVPLKAAKHAVKMQNGDTRAWYGMMHLVPDRAIVQSSPRRTFADMKKAMTLSAGKTRKFGDAVLSPGEEQLQALSIGCGFSTEVDNQFGLGKAVSSSSTSRRRLQHVQSPGECNNVTNFFCWMQCLEIPNYEQAQGFINEGYSLYCLDPAALASSGNRVSSAAQPCEYGFVHNANCQGSWQPTAPGVIAYPVNVKPQEVQESFCYGGTSMYMDGFHWLDSTCVIYLFPRWVLSTPAKFAAATIGTLFPGMALEKIIQQRRVIVSSMGPGYRRLGVSSLFYAFQLTMGYLIMLVVMTFSAPLFLAVVLGLVGGHVLFNASDAFFPGAKAPPQATKESAGEINDIGEKPSHVDGKVEQADKTADCSRDNSALAEDSCCKETKPLEVPVPEGITPCCLNTL